MNKKSVLVTSAFLLASFATFGVLDKAPATKADTSPLIQEVNNHEVRIGNAEKNIRDLQTKTNTPPASDTISTDTPTNSPITDNTMATQSEPSTPPTVVSYKEIVIDSGTSDCEYTYSDGSTYTFHWKNTNPEGSWVTDGQGQNGHWVASTNYSGYCDDRALGWPKAN